MSSTLLEWSAVSDLGLVRKNNEDAFAVVEITEAARAVVQPADGSSAAIGAGGHVFMVSDGVGGANAGEVASGLVITVVPEALASLGRCSVDVPNRNCGRQLEAAVRQANGRIRQEAAADPQRAGMAATLSLLWLLPERAILAQVGDSRVYRWRHGQLVQLTHDQSEVGRMVRSGRLSEAQAKGYRGRNVIDQSMGTPAEQFDPVLDWVETEPGDVFLLCSDGLVDRLENRHLAEILAASFDRGATLRATVDELIQRSNAASGRDNTTAVLVRLPGGAPAAEGAPPPLPSTARSFGEPPTVPQAAPSASGRSLALVAATACLAGCVLGAAVLWLGWHRPRSRAFEEERADIVRRYQDVKQSHAESERSAAAVLAEREATIDRLTDEIKQQRLALAAHQERTTKVGETARVLEARIVELEAELRTARAQIKDLEAALAAEIAARAPTVDTSAEGADGAAESVPSTAPVVPGEASPPPE